MTTALSKPDVDKLAAQIGDAKFRIIGPSVRFPESTFWYQIDRVEGNAIVLKIASAPE